MLLVYHLHQWILYQLHLYFKGRDESHGKRSASSSLSCYYSKLSLGADEAPSGSGLRVLISIHSLIAQLVPLLSFRAPVISSLTCFGKYWNCQGALLCYTYPVSL